MTIEKYGIAFLRVRLLDRVCLPVLFVADRSLAFRETVRIASMKLERHKSLNVSNLYRESRRIQFSILPLWLFTKGWNSISCQTGTTSCGTKRKKRKGVWLDSHGFRVLSAPKTFLNSQVSDFLLVTWVFPKIVVPQNGWFIRENPMNKWMIWGYTHLLPDWFLKI